MTLLSFWAICTQEKIEKKIKKILTTEAPSPRTTFRAKSGTGSHEGLPKTFPKCSHISANRTGLGAVPLITPEIKVLTTAFNILKSSENQYHMDSLGENLITPEILVIVEKLNTFIVYLYAGMVKKTFDIYCDCICQLIWVALRREQDIIIWNSMLD